MQLAEAAQIVQTASDTIYEAEDKTLALSSLILVTLAGLLLEPAPETIATLGRHCVELAGQRADLLNR